MDQDLFSVFREQAGAQYQTPPPGVFIPVDEHRVWVVESGRLELFLVHQSGTGLRHFVTPVEPTQALFGLRDAANIPLRLIAKAATGTKLLSMSQRRLRNLARSHVHQSSITALLETWVDQLANALSPNESAPDPIFLSDGHMTIQDDQARSVATNQGIVWMKIIRGGAHFAGNLKVEAIKNNTYFPVTNKGWVLANAASSIQGLTSDMWADADVHWSGLEQFHQVLLETWLAKWQTLERQEALRLRSRATSNEHEARRLRSRNKLDEALVHSSLLRMVTPLMQSTEDDDLQTAIGSDPLLTACTVVFRKLGSDLPARRNSIPQGTPEETVRQIAENANVRVRSVLFEGPWWKRANGFFLAFRASDNRPLAILPSLRGRYKIFDPVDGRTSALNSQTAAALAVRGYHVYRPLPETRIGPRQLLWFSMRGCKKELLVIVLMGVGAGLLGIIPPIFMGLLIDSVIPGAERSQLLQLALLLVAIAISNALITTTRIYALLRLEGKIDGPLQAAVWDRLLRLPASFFQGFNSGDLADRGMGINEVRRTLTGSTLSSILTGVFSIFSFALLFYYSPFLAFIAAGLVAVGFAVSLVCGYMQIRLQRSLSRLRGQLTGIVLQLLSGIAKFRVCGAERRAFAVWAKIYAKQKETTMKARRVSNTLAVFNAGFPLFCLGLIFLFAEHLVPHSFGGSNNFQVGLSTGSFIAFLAAFTQFMVAALQLSYTLVSVLNVVPLIERVSPILSTMPELSGVQADPGQLSGHIEVSHLAFRYKPDSPHVLRDISFSVQPGQCIAILGASGCGKSTLLRMLLGFEQPECGAVYYDKKDLSGLDILAVRRQMGVVLQQGFLMDGDILTNIIGSSPLSIDDAWEAARSAGIADEIKQMPNGMNTMITDRGSGLSGGQRQRIMIARAIATKPRILLFDEGTSALDNRTQAIVTESLARLKATRIIVAHRVSTVINADYLLVLDKGAVVESGKYDELMAKQGAFYRIAARQVM